ncbi:MAG: DUF1580 domain-containing protein [Planctomycetota bacterium]|nr:DUF1580 domain-containing protein [Planctomycetota bacterium]
MSVDITPERLFTFNESTDHRGPAEEDRLLTFNEAAKRYLPDRSRPSYSTWWRWWRRGIKGIRLATVVVGGRRYTTASAVQDWIDKVTAAASGESRPIRTPRQRELCIKRAEETLGLNATGREAGGKS